MYGQLHHTGWRSQCHKTWLRTTLGLSAVGVRDFRTLISSGSSTAFVSQVSILLYSHIFTRCCCQCFSSSLVTRSWVKSVTMMWLIQRLEVKGLGFGEGLPLSENLLNFAPQNGEPRRSQNFCLEVGRWLELFFPLPIFSLSFFSF